MQQGRDFRLTIVGGGPSCTYILERLAATVPELAGKIRLHIDVYDRTGQFGAGSVHSYNQPATSYLNRIVAQVAFAADESVREAGRLLEQPLRPTLHEWCQRKFAETGDESFDLAPEDWPKRYVHGLALRDCFERYVELLRGNEGVEVELHEAEVVDIVDRGERLEVIAGDDRERTLADHVVLVTGHSSNRPHRPRERALAEFAERSPAVFIPSAYPLEENVVGEVASPEKVVACNGMGLTAIDIILYLTEARGGHFEADESGRLTYVPCGREPERIVPFSESGLFTFARPFNAKEEDLDRLQHKSVFLTHEAVDRLRDSVGLPPREDGTSRRQIDFERDIFPVVLLEMAYLYYRTLLGEEFGECLRRRALPTYERFLGGERGLRQGDPEVLLEPVNALVDEAVATIDGVLLGEGGVAELKGDSRDWPTTAAFARHLEVVLGAETARRALERLAAGEPGPRVLSDCSSPYCHELTLGAKRFSWREAIEPVPRADQATPESYRKAMLAFFERDHRWAAQGNLANPAKAAADGVWRDSRPVLAYAVDFGGLTASSHRTFLEIYMRHHNRLANGAGLEVMEKIRALAESGIVDVSIGPDATVEPDEDSGCFRIRGGRTGAEIHADTFIGGTVHPFDPERDVLSLYPNLLGRGLIRKWRNPSAAGEPYEPGGLDLSPRFHPCRADGAVDERLTLLGPPSEGVMFFQLGALRPNQDHHVMRDILCWLGDFKAQVADRLDGAREVAEGLAEEVVGSSISITEEPSAVALRRQLARPGLLRVGGVHDALSALVAERCGLDALWASGLGIAASHGVPDANILTLGEVRDAARLIVSASRLPVIADCDTGFGEVRNLRRTVAEFEHAGVAAICIEDKLYPKRNSFGPSGQQLIDPYEFAAKIRAAKDTQRSADLVIVARLESLIAGETVAEAMARAHLYVAAGADALVVHSKAKTPEQVIEFATAWRAQGREIPLIAIPTTYNEVTVEELERAGFSMAIYANQSLRAAVGAMEETMRRIVNAGSSRPVESAIPSVASIFELTGEDEISRYDEWFTQTTEEARRRAGTTV
ncbi:MAG TPA: isocitrate lyase/phosphoenolpyruvate mutase family protein [Solirubrobacterales bacterium]|nr:isocitrate lyase/phosphoenolpyruvate mutase family protein [Solirubrobacterales bacterium]